LTAGAGVDVVVVSMRWGNWENGKIGKVGKIGKIGKIEKTGKIGKRVAFFGKPGVLDSIAYIASPPVPSHTVP